MLALSILPQWSYKGSLTSLPWRRRIPGEEQRVLITNLPFPFHLHKPLVPKGLHSLPLPFGSRPPSTPQNLRLRQWVDTRTLSCWNPSYRWKLESSGVCIVFIWTWTSSKFPRTSSKVLQYMRVGGQAHTGQLSVCGLMSRPRWPQ